MKRSQLIADNIKHSACSDFIKNFRDRLRELKRRCKRIRERRNEL